MAVIGASASPIKSIQRGSTSVTASGSATVTINAVDLDKSFVSANTKTGYISSGTGGPGNENGVTLSSSTSLQFYGGVTYYSPGTVAATTYWEVIEYV